jgi:hypothetical protein
MTILREWRAEIRRKLKSEYVGYVNVSVSHYESAAPIAT